MFRRRSDLFAVLVVALTACWKDRPAQPEAQSSNSTTTMRQVQAASEPAEAECARKVAALREALANDRLVKMETFEKYPAEERLDQAPVGPDLSSNRYAREFRTRLRQELEQHGVNFAGAWSVVSVGMTGWGDNWTIVDRRTGQVTLFPYNAASLDFREDSTLIVMNSKQWIESEMRANDVDCYFLNQQEFTSLRPFYFLWTKGRLVRLGPNDIEPPPNRFWNEYLPRLQ